MADLEPDDQRGLGRLKYGNPSGDRSKSPRCGAKTRRGLSCKAPAMRSRKTGEYTRCRLHGGASTGPKTGEGLERCRLARLKHGLRSAAAVQQRKRDVAERRRFREESAILCTPWRTLKKGLLKSRAIVVDVGVDGSIAELRRDVLDGNVASLVKQEICLQQARIDAYQDRWDRMKRLMAARAAAGWDAPGADTGLLVQRRRSIGAGGFTAKIEEFKVDTGLLREMRELEKQAAVELGQLAGRAARTVRPAVPPEVKILAEALTPQELRELEKKLLAARQKQIAAAAARPVVDVQAERRTIPVAGEEKGT